jgi:hypothetical protein
MTSFGEWLSQLGNLHDCTVRHLVWSRENKTIEFDIEDVCFNFEGTPAYNGPVPGRVLLEGVESVDIARSCSGPLRIFEMMLVQTDNGSSFVNTSFWPAGKINVRCRRVLHSDVPTL